MKTQSFTDYVQSRFLRYLQSHAPTDGGTTADAADFIREHNGDMEQLFKDKIYAEALISTIRKVKHKLRDENDPSIPAIHSVQTPTGRFDDDGNPIFEERLVLYARVIEEQDSKMNNRIADNYFRRGRAMFRIGTELST